MRYFLDTEFIEYPCTIDLISIGIVCDDGRELYNISSEFDASKASDWVKENVLSKLGDEPRISMDEIKKNILKFIGDDDSVEFWGWYCDFDWVAFCWIFGSMINLPKQFPKRCNDLKQLMKIVGFNERLEKPKNEHRAVDDARWNLQVYGMMVEYAKKYYKTIGIYM